MEQKDRIDSKLLGTFEIVEKLGEGGSGIVWKVIHNQKMILCALKKYENVFETRLKAQRIYREIEILSQLQSCDQIMGLYEAIETINEDSSDFYLVLKYMPCDLKRVIKCKILNKIHIRHIIV